MTDYSYFPNIVIIFCYILKKRLSLTAFSFLNNSFYKNKSRYTDKRRAGAAIRPTALFDFVFFHT